MWATARATRSRGCPTTTVCSATQSCGWRRTKAAASPSDSTVTRRGGYAKGRERREAILAAADRLFAQQGFRGASLAAIASQVGLSEAGVLHHFPSKEHLLLELLQLRGERDSERVERMVERH